jgi:hypothetical protein
MKRIFAAMTLLAIVFSTSSFASDIKTTEVLATFHNTFRYAKNVNFIEVNDMLKITFTEDSKSYIAYYTADGDLMGLSRQLTASELPVSLQEQLKRKYSRFEITEVYTIEMEGRSQYYVAISNESEQLILNSPGKKWMVFKKKKA